MNPHNNHQHSNHPQGHPQGLTLATSPPLSATSVLSPLNPLQSPAINSPNFHLKQQQLLTPVTPHTQQPQPQQLPNSASYYSQNPNLAYVAPDYSSSTALATPTSATIPISVPFSQSNNGPLSTSPSASASASSASSSSASAHPQQTLLSSSSSSTSAPTHPQTAPLPLSRSSPPQPFSSSRKPASSSTTTPSSSSSTSILSPAHCVLQNLFARFVRAAENKVNALMFLHLDREVDLSAPIRAGADTEFDRLLQSLGSISKHCPKLMIDSIMVWRKSKSESVGDVRHLAGLYPHMKEKVLETHLKERKLLIANFILCRALIEIIRHLSKNTLPDDLGDKLEDMVFQQLKNADPELTSRNINRMANLDFFAELIGALSGIRFGTVSDRFVAELGRSGGMKENKVEQIVRSMRFLKLKIYPMDALEETADFLQICAEFYQNAHNMKLKHAFADLFVELLEPIAAVATAEVNLPAWMKTVELIFPKGIKMIAKPRHLPAAIPLVTTLLCVSRPPFFHKHWLAFIETCIQRFRDKHLRHTALSCVVRLLWVYLFRCTETSTATATRRVDMIVRAVFPPNRRGVVPEGVNLDVVVQMVWFICVRYLEYGVDTVLPMLIGFEGGSAGTSNNGSSVGGSSGIGAISGGGVGTMLSSTSGGGGSYAASAHTFNPSSPSHTVGGSSSNVFNVTSTVLVQNNVLSPASSSTVGHTTITSSFDDLMATASAVVSGSGGGGGGGGSGSGAMTSTSSIIIGDRVVNPERLIVGFRAFLLLLADMEETLGGGPSGPGGSGMMLGPGGAITGGAVSTVGSAGSGTGVVVVEGK
ncbi:Cell morphogenesis protein PAG1, partial [Quaeritorhiza haematococci]